MPLLKDNREELVAVAVPDVAAGHAALDVADVQVADHVAALDVRHVGPADVRLVVQVADHADVLHVVRHVVDVAQSVLAVAQNVEVVGVPRLVRSAIATVVRREDNREEDIDYVVVDKAANVSTQRSTHHAVVLRFLLTSVVANVNWATMAECGTQRRILTAFADGNVCKSLTMG